MDESVKKQTLTEVSNDVRTHNANMHRHGMELHGEDAFRNKAGAC